MVWPIKILRNRYFERILFTLRGTAHLNHNLPISSFLSIRGLHFLTQTGSHDAGTF